MNDYLKHGGKLMRKLYILIIDFWWFIEHRKGENIATYGYRKRKLWERKYVARFNESIYGEEL